MQQVSANVYVETGYRGCNPGFVTTSEGIVMVDSPQRPSDAVEWRRRMEGRGEVRYLVNTEPHGDHVAGNFFFPGTVVAHEGTREALSALSLAELIERTKAIDPDGAALMEGYRLKGPTITFSQRLTLYLGSHTFELMHMPGHTASELAVYIPEEKVVFVGDNVFCRVQTFLHQAHPQEWLQSLERIAALDAAVVVPGHGEVCDRGYLAEQAAFIEEWVAAVRDAVERGLSREQAQAEISFLDRYPMGQGMEAMGPSVQRMNIDRLYDLLSAGRDR